MHFYNTDIPAALVDAAFSGSLVLFCGAGISMQSPMKLPSFNDLVDRIKKNVDPANRLRGRRSSDAKNGSLIYSESPEQYLGYLESRGRDVRASCAALLASNGEASQLHSNLLRLFPNGHPIRIVTTNFDDCFENALNLEGRKCRIYTSPALPLGSDVNGLVYLHGSIDDDKSMVLTAEDYGRAYVSIGWASHFLVELFKSYTVLFVGYSCGDSLVDYLTRSISSDMSGRAFALCKKTDDVDDWRMRGVEPVTFDEFDDLAPLTTEWVYYIEQSVTDRVRVLKRLATIQELTSEQRDYLTHSFRWPDNDDRALFVREFCNQSSCFNHLSLLHEEGFTSCMYKDNPTESDSELLRWVVAQFAVSHHNNLQTLLAHIRSKLSVHFYKQLVWDLAYKDAPSAVIGPWILWLQSAPRHYLTQCVHHLVHIASSCDSPDIVLTLLKVLLRVEIGSSDRILLGIQQEPINFIIDLDYVKQLLIALKNHKDAIGEQVFYYCLEQIEVAYSIQTGCWTCGDVFDGISFSRSAVEPHEQDRIVDDAGSILLDFARESFSPAIADWAVNRCFGSRCNLIIRLGLWITERYNCTGDCLELIADKGFLENTYLHHEAFHLTRSSFAVATITQREMFVDYIRSLYGSDRDSDYECFNLCSWILATIDDQALLALRSEMLEKHPEYLVTNHPDFTHYFSVHRVNNTARDELPRTGFSIESMLERLRQAKKQQSDVALLDIVSGPANEYPDLAASMLEELLKRGRTAEETTLCKLLVASMPWGSPLVNRDKAVVLLKTALTDCETCTDTIKTLFLNHSHSSEGITWTQQELEQLLLAAKQNLPALLELKLAMVPSEESDWVSIGINHPAGQYLMLLAKLERTARTNGTTSEVALSLLKDIDILSLPESQTAKALVACFFSHFNIWTEVDTEYARRLVVLLTDESWSQAPAWQGLSKLHRLSEDAWKMTKACWNKLFKGCITIGGKLLERLSQLYIWLAIAMADLEDRIYMLKTCGSASDNSLHTACMLIDNWLGSLDEREQNQQWCKWLSSSFEFLAKYSDQSKQTVAGFYCRWIRIYPALRRFLVERITKDCIDIKNRGLFVHEGTLNDIAIDSNLTNKEKAVAITFLLEHQRLFTDEIEAREAASYINLDDLERDTAIQLQDAYTRCGMSDVFS